VFDLSEIKHLSSGGKGVILMDLDNNEKLQAVQVISQQGVTISGIGRTGKLQEINLSVASLAPYLHKRARKGRRLEVKFKPADLKIGITHLR
jgi:topoisomerase-4 subunit A